MPSCSFSHHTNPFICHAPTFHTSCTLSLYKLPYISLQHPLVDSTKCIPNTIRNWSCISSYNIYPIWSLDVLYSFTKITLPSIPSFLESSTHFFCFKCSTSPQHIYRLYTIYYHDLINIFHHRLDLLWYYFTHKYLDWETHSGNLPIEIELNITINKYSPNNSNTRHRI